MQAAFLSSCVPAIKLVSHSQNQLVVNSSELTAFCPPFYEILSQDDPPCLPPSFPPLDFYRQGFFWPQSLFSLLDAFHVENARSTKFVLYFTFYILASVNQADLLLVVPTSYVFTAFLYCIILVRSGQLNGQTQVRRSVNVSKLSTISTTLYHSEVGGQLRPPSGLMRGWSVIILIYIIIESYRSCCSKFPNKRNRN